jgi:hypothetical protein
MKTTINTEVLKELLRLIAPISGVNSDESARLSSAARLIRAALAAQQELPEKILTQAPVDMVLYCPKCGLQHIDAPDTEKDANPVPCGGVEMDTEWTNPPHKSHLCHGCGHIWRPSDTPTNGVAATVSGKDADTQPAELCRDEGCPQHGVAHVCVPPKPLVHVATITRWKDDPHGQRVHFELHWAYLPPGTKLFKERK